MTPMQLQILQHALGADEYGRVTGCRNYFVTDADGADGVVCEELVALGLMVKRDGDHELTAGMPLYLVTPEGIGAMREGSLKPPKPRTPSQQRYADFLHADSGLTFIEWLRSKRKAVPA